MIKSCTLLIRLDHKPWKVMKADLEGETANYVRQTEDYKYPETNYVHGLYN